MGYKVGDLQVSLESIDNGTISTFDALISKMSSLSTLVKSVTVSDLKWVTSLGSRMKTLSKKMNEVDWGKVQKGFDGLTVAISPFLNKVITAESSLKSLNETLNKVNGRKLKSLSNVDFVGGAGAGAGARKMGVGGLARISATLYTARRLARAVGSIVKQGSDYTETLNLWQVAMRKNLNAATEFVTKMNKAYSISERTVMQAQATFKNMIGSLGDLSEQASYNLSEAITQMAIDYSSLYNVSIEDAIYKFQSALAGQVRPIRSVSGYDITEKTIYAVYEAMGGTKTMRQLSRTEKQLLSIYAVFNQMGASGALGDMTKTLGNFANQSRMMVENWQQTASWAGVIATHALETSGIMVWINALLITTSNVLRAIAKGMGAGQQNFIDDMFESTQLTNDAVDELQGKLLDFDKFRSLSSQEQTGVQLDQALLNAISGYNSQIMQANNEAQKLAEIWTDFWVDPETSGLTTEAEILLDILKAMGIVLGGLVGYKLITKIGSLAGKITGLTTAMKLLNGVLVVGIIASFIRAIELFEEGNIWGGVLATTIGVTLVGAFVLANKQALLTFWQTLGKKVIPMIMSTILSFGGLKAMILSVASSAVTFGLAFMGAWAILSILPNGAQKVVGAIMAIAGAFIALTTAILAYKGVMTWGTALPVLTASIGAAIAGGMAYKGKIQSIAEYAEGGMPDKGTLFVAGEAGAEMVYNTPSGQSGVANIQQIQQAMYGAMVAYGRTQGNGTSDNRPIDIYIDGEKLFQATKKNAKRHGLAFSKV